MHYFTKRNFLTLLMAGATATGILAAPPSFKNRSASARYRAHSAAPFRNDRAKAIEKINSRIFGDDPAIFKAPSPQHQVGPANVIGDLDGPGGENWFYTGKLTYDSIPPHDDVMFTELILREYEMTVYDTEFNVVGTVRDKMRYRDGEVRVPLCDMAPIVSRHFWNTDDSLEVMVGLGINAGVGEVHYRTLVYRLGGEKVDSYDVPVAEVETILTDVLDASTPEEENLYMTFTHDDYTDWNFPDDFDWENGSEEYWTQLCSNKMAFDIYGKAADNTAGPQLLLSKAIPLPNLPGDQMNASALLTYMHEGSPVFMFSVYKDTFYNPYYTPADENVTMREDNSLVCDFYTPKKGKLQMTDRIMIPVARDQVDEVLASYYSVGSMRWREDINYDDYDTKGGRPALIVTKQNYMVGNDDSYISSYYVYGPDGKRHNTIFENADSSVSLSDVEGCERQQMFIDMAGGAYTFHFIDLVSCREALRVNYAYEIDPEEEPEVLTANVDRYGSAGSYMYAFEMRVPTIDDEENDNARVMWLNSDGSFNHIDEINMGHSVMYATIYIAAPVLDPTFYCADPEREYMLLIKRGTADTGSTEELLVAQARNATAPQGYDFLLASADARGALNSILPIFSEEGNRLLVSRFDSETSIYNVDFYSLPFVKEDSGVASADAGAKGISFAEGIISADGEITLYAADGTVAASGRGSIDARTLPAGIYIARAGTETLKIRL